MTGDETNKHRTCGKLTHKMGCCCDLEPVASKAGEKSELKPCPFCGKDPDKQHDSDLTSDCDCILFNDSGPFVRIETCNNAWAHKKIAALEARNAQLKSENIEIINMAEAKSRLDKQKIADLENRLASAKNWTPTQASPCSLCTYHEGILTSSCGYHIYQSDLEKRNAELEEWERNFDGVKANWESAERKVGELKIKLKTAEDALAAVTKEKDSLNDRLAVIRLLNEMKERL